MSFKKTLILSVLLHLCLFAAALLLSADLLRDSSKMLNEKVFFVKLAEDISKSGNEQSIVKTKKAVSKKFFQIKAEKKPLLDTQNKTVPVKTDSANENNNDLNTPEEHTSSILLADYKAGEDYVVDIPYGQETSGNVEVSEGKNRKVLNAKIIEIIRNSIERAKNYPLLARKRGIEGTIYISFRISPQGEPQNLKILKSSGSRILDTATLDIVKKAAPFPYADSPIEVPVVFRLKN